MLNISRRSLLASAAAVSILPAAEAQAAKAPSWNKSAELVVAGGGAAGCMAAIEAARAGRKVLIVQVHGFLGGSSAVSSGWIRSCNTHWHAKRGIVDTPED